MKLNLSDIDINLTFLEWLEVIKFKIAIDKINGKA